MLYSVPQPGDIFGFPYGHYKVISLETMTIDDEGFVSHCHFHGSMTYYKKENGKYIEGCFDYSDEH